MLTRAEAVSSPAAALIPGRGDAAPLVWWVGCHGGAGVSTLAKLSGVGVDAGLVWPTSDDQDQVPAAVVVVCQATATGTTAATEAVEQWRAGQLSTHARLLGVVAVAATPRRWPRIAEQRLRLLHGWVTVWRVGWVDALLAVDEPRDVGLPPDVAALRHAIGSAVDGGRHGD